MQPGRQSEPRETFDSFAPVLTAPAGRSRRADDYGEEETDAHPDGQPTAPDGQPTAPDGQPTVDARRLITRLPALDGIRGVFMVTVTLFHSGHLSGAFFSVDIFFVLSGYLITLLLLDEHVAHRHIGLKRFWGRRVRRLAPAMLVTLTGTLALIALVFGLPAMQDNLHQALLALLSVSNFYEMGSPSATITPYQHTWSLGVEEQFYLVWPLVVAGVLLLRRRSGRGDSASCAKTLMLVALAGAAFSQLLMIGLHDGPSTLARVYYSTDTRMAPILLGAALACATTAFGFIPNGRPRVLLEVAGLAAVVAIVWSFLFVNRPADTTFEGGYLVFIIIATIFLTAAAHPVRGPIAMFLSFRPFVLFGLISYGVYLWHWPMFFILNTNNTGLSEWSLLALQMAVTTVIATVSFVFIEQPIRRRHWPFTDTGVTPALRRVWSSINSSSSRPEPVNAISGS
jgi:peptidoglycan/LPS O-acetylase OafA/YrhL